MTLIRYSSLPLGLATLFFANLSLAGSFPSGRGVDNISRLIVGS